MKEGSSKRAFAPPTRSSHSKPESAPPGDSLLSRSKQILKARFGLFESLFRQLNPPIHEVSRYYDRFSLWSYLATPEGIYLAGRSDQEPIIVSVISP